MTLKLKRFSKTGVWGGIKNLLFGNSQNQIKPKNESNQSEGTLEKAIEDLKKFAEENIKRANICLDRFKINNSYVKKYKTWFTNKGINLPKDIISFISGCSKFFTKENINKFYKDYISNPKRFITKENLSLSDLCRICPDFFW